MKKIDVENSITNYISNNNLNIIDCLSKRYSIISFEDYKYKFNLIYTTYKNNITEYAEEGKKYIDFIDNFINKALNESTEDDLEKYITDNFKNGVNFNSYNREVQLISVFPDSFSEQRELSKEAFFNIYTELGYSKLTDYIILLKSPSYFSSYINDANKQIIAMKFLLFKTDHHSPTKFKRDLSAQTIYKMNSENIVKTFSEITKEKSDFISYMDNQKENYRKWFEGTSNDINQFKIEHSNKLSYIEDTYESKLKVEKPAEFMLEQSKKYKISLFLWSGAIIALTILFLFILKLIISPEITFNDKVININILDNDMTVYSGIILLTLISLIIYILRIFIQMAISSKHLMEEYKQKYSLTYFYLSLVNNGDIKDEQSKNIILTSLFTKADTGLIKNDSSNDIDKTILSLLTKVK